MTNSLIPPAPLRPGLRAEWMLKDGITFLNHGSFGAMPRAVFDAQNDWRRRIEAEPIEIIGRRSAELIEQAKLPLGEHFGMQLANFGFVTNATEGVNAVLRSVSFKPGDELLTTDHVYHAVRQAMKLTARRSGATVREVPVPLPVASAEQIQNLILAALSPATRLLVIDHITSPTGLIFPMEGIIAGCRARGVEVLVDGAHAPGMLPLHVENLAATYYTGNFHKWVCAPKGSAFLWVAPSRRADVHPAVISHHLDEGFAREFAWQGTRDFSSWFTTPMALAFMSDLGWPNIMSHNHSLAAWAHDLLRTRFATAPLSPRDGSLLGSTATVPLPAGWSALTGKELESLQQRLYTEFKIEVPMFRWNNQNLLRVSCQVYNTPSDYERLADVVTGLV